MAIENVMLTLNRVPEIVLNTGTDYKILGGFLLTALVVVAGSAASIYTFRKTVASQEKIAAATAIRASRQAWINEFRDSCANYVAAVTHIADLRMERSSWIVGKRIQMPKWQAYQAFVSENPSWAGYATSAVNQARMLRAKVELLLNPSEKEATDLLSAMDAIYTAADKELENLSALCDEVVRCAQLIVSAEWQVTKSGK